MSDKKPFEIAREALKQITAGQLAPTPVNYQAIYNEIAGLPNVQPFPEEPLRQIAQALPTRNKHEVFRPPSAGRNALRAD